MKVLGRQRWTVRALMGVFSIIALTATANAQSAANCSPQANSCQARCNSRTTQAAKNLCMKMCGMGQQSCEQSARDQRARAPDNAHNPLTRFYPNAVAMQADPKYPAAYNAWKTCLYRDNRRAFGPADEARCKNLDPENSVRR